MDITSILIIIFAIVIFIGGILISLKNKGFREVVISLIVEAEKVFEYGKNSDKFNYVYEHYYNQLPLLFKFILTKKNVISFIQTVFDEIKISLDYRDRIIE